MTKTVKRLKDEDITIAETAKVAEKECKRCGATKTADEFGLRIKTGTKIAYLHGWCIECRQARSKEQRQARKQGGCFGKEYSRRRKCITCILAKDCTEAWYRAIPNKFTYDDD